MNSCLSLREGQQTKLKGPRVQSPYSANIGDVVLLKDDLREVAGD